MTNFRRDPEREAKAYKAWEAGLSGRETALLLGCSRNAATALWDRMGLKRKMIKTHTTPGGIFVNERAPNSTKQGGEPSFAMIRLAQHDPVVARALAERRGEPFELERGLNAFGFISQHIKKRGDY